MLIDTSAWICYDREPESDMALYLERYIRQPSLKIYTCPTIIQEYCQGVKDKKYDDAVDFFSWLEILTFADQVATALGAAQVYRACRKKSFIIRKANDCLIAYYALQHDLELLHWGKDFNFIAKVLPLRIYLMSKKVT